MAKKNYWLDMYLQGLEESKEDDFFDKLIELAVKFDAKIGGGLVEDTKGDRDDKGKQTNAK